MNEIEAVIGFYANPLIDSKAAPFSEQEILSEKDPEVQRAMMYILGLLGLKRVGKSREHLENNIESAILGKALAKLCVAKKLNRSQCIAMINQLFQ